MKAVTTTVLRRTAIGVVAALTLASVLTAESAAKKTYFTGVEGNYVLEPGQWFGDGANLVAFRRACDADEDITDPRLKGLGSWTYAVDAVAGKFWGWGRIVPDQGGGEWTGYFTGTMSLGTTLHMTLTGSGEYAGLVARLTYTEGPQPHTLAISGYIVEAKGGPGERPLKITACRAERWQLLPCLELDPASWPPAPFDPPRPAMVLKADIVSEVAQATHAGRSSNEGISLVDPVTGAITGTGTAIAANGDTLFWVFDGIHGPTGVPEGHIHFCGGTGRFDAVVGMVEIEITSGPVPTDDPWVMEMCYRGIGTIRY